MIRRTAALLILTLFLAVPASGQNVPGLTDFGVKAGPTFSTLRGNIVDEDGNGGLGYRTGFTGGAYGQVEVIPYFSPRLEVLYTQRGASVDETGNFGDDDTLHLNYIQVPLLAKFNLPVLRQVFPSLYAGPYVSFAVDKEVDLGDSDDEELEGAFGDTDYGLILGTDVDFTFAQKTLTLSARYDLGLANVVNDESVLDDAGVDPEDLSNTGFTVTLGFGI